MRLTLRLLVAAAAVAALSAAQGASAADLPAKAPIYKAPPAPVFDWTGFYLGGYAGVAASQSRSLDPSGITTGTLQHTGYGFTGGGTIGYNWQLGNALFGNKWVVGLEGDIGYFDASHGTSDWEKGQSSIIYDEKTSWLATVRGRIGWADGPNFGYLTGGYAALGVKDINANAVTGFEVSSSQTRSGWAIGTGTETMLGGGWSAKAESLYINVGRGDTLANPTNGAILQTDKHEYQTQRFGLNYSFGAKTGPLPQTNWNGFYLGGTAGTTLASVRGHSDDNAPLGAGEIGNNATGFFIGGQAGYNWMFGPRLVAGIEGDFSYFSSKQTNLHFGNGVISEVDASWIATLRGRLGYSTGPALLYATGGAAWVNVTDTFDWGGSPFAVGKKTLDGWTIGGGIETVLSGNWTMKSEYLFVDAGTNRLLTEFGPFLADHKFHLFRTSLVYRFSGNPLSGL
jgi:outer membrane immunogenic protein